MTENIKKLISIINSNEELTVLTNELRRKIKKNIKDFDEQKLFISQLNDEISQKNNQMQELSIKIIEIKEKYKIH